MAELDSRCVAQLDFSDTLQPTGFDVLAPGADSASGAEVWVEHAVALLQDRLNGQTPADGLRADVGD